MKEDFCTHDNYSKDYIAGMHTGDYICDSCGAAFASRAEADAASSAAHAKLKKAQDEEPE